ncbi:MAG: ATP-dependent Clp protease adaptor ClpS [Bacteroidales bacterium]|nr:ATP-dependent Clp protease adaptor ClpS [Bacteroidales bacterium]
MAKQQTKTTRRVRIREDEPPKRFAVIMHNDEVTTMDFVVYVLENIFFKSHDLAEQIMMEVHTKGSAIVGVYDYDTAVSKALKTMRIASGKNFPLKLTWQEE